MKEFMGHPIKEIEDHIETNSSSHGLPSYLWILEIKDLLEGTERAKSFEIALKLYPILKDTKLFKILNS